MSATATSSPTAARASIRLHRAVTWLGALAVVGLDAAIATPVGLPVLYVIPIAWAGLRLGRRETVALAVCCATARILFGPVGGPLSLARTALTVPEDVQLWFNAATSLVGYVGVGWLVASLARSRRVITGLRSAAHLDPLTGLANRRALDALLLSSPGRAGAVVALDLDRFKSINDTYGHAAGDRVLVELGRRLRRVVRAGDLLARIGGEEFVIVLPDAPAAVAKRVGEHVCDVVRAEPFDLGDGSLRVTTSVGAATGALGSDLVRVADAALYEAKHTGRDRCVLATPDTGLRDDVPSPLVRGSY